VPILELQGNNCREIKGRERVMRINTDHGSQPLNEGARSNTTKASTENNQASGSSSLGADQAQLLGAGAQVTALTAQVLQLPEVRQARVQALRQAVEAGNYAPDPRDVASALLDHLALKPAA
jgi:flagellar biosynthesis anti-sigma factor FlgM